MAEDLVVRVSFDGILEPASPSLQNCIKFSNSGRYFSALCDFGAVCICQLTEVDEDFKAVLIKRLTFGKGELLESHAWSSDDQIFAVAGCKIYLSKVCQGFTSLYTIALYYLPKDISLIVADCFSLHKMYTLAVAGPNGVELYQMEIADNFKMGGSSALHSDLAIALVEFSPDLHYLAVAALDGHFGIWTISSLGTDQKEFWYVHLKTVRITSMEFSPDSTMIAVAGWEGSWYLYRKIVQGEKVTWEELHYSASVDRVSGDLPGSFISWSPDNRFVRLTQCNGKTSCLSTFDTQTSVTTGISLDGVVKGMASFRRMSGDYTLCVLRSKQCRVVKWPTSESDSVKASAAHKEETKLLFQESLEGSLLVERSVTGGVTLQWKRASQHILVLLRKINERGSEITESYQPSEMQQCSVRERIIKNNQHGKEESRSVQCNQDEIFRTEVLQQDDGHVKSRTDCRQENSSRHFVKSSEGSSKNTELSNDRSKEDESGEVTEHRSLKEAERDSSGMSVELHAVACTDNTSKNVSQVGNVLTTSEENTCGSVYTSDGSFTKGRCTRSNEQPNVTCRSRLSNEVVLIEAPFLNQRLFQTSGTHSLSPSLTSTVKLLITTNYVIVAILPLLAYVYHHEKEEWQSLLFPVAVKSCCVAQGKYLALLTNEGELRIWCLPSMTMLHSSHEVLCATKKSDFERYTMTGHQFEPKFSIVKLDKAGAGEVLRVSFQPNHSDFSLSVTRLLVCYPGLLGVSCASRVCGSVGHLIIFKQRQDPEGGDETSQEHEGLPLVKWVVIIPELRISSSFLEEPNCSLEQFIVCHHEALGQLDTLTVATL